ncbi:transposase [Sphingobium sp. AS12]|uniref:transposase n=1 Tax=Sphingobium sp. AS12 TaxID=2849495 RepID=UPI0020C86096|nr:transposase [Sphingobium sp. AS12]
MSGELAGVRKVADPAFAEVRIGEPPALPNPLMAPLVSGLIGIELPSGIKVTVDAAVDADVLSRVIGALPR